MLFIVILGSDIPSMRDLYTHVVYQQAHEWDRLGLELGVPCHVIANIGMDNSQNPNRLAMFCAVMLQKWLHTDVNLTWGKLDDTIKKIKLSTTSPVSTDREGIILLCIYVYMVVKRQNYVFHFCNYTIVANLFNCVSQMVATIQEITFSMLKVFGSLC